MEELREVMCFFGFKFNPAKIDDDLHKTCDKRISHAVHNKMIKLFDMCESDLDGDQVRAGI